MQERAELLVTNIQRMCFHDGPGIRTTVFTKGCSLHCPWCSNPENINFNIEPYSDEGKEGIYGEFFDAVKLVNILMKDEKFWSDGGGVTFSGGEALMQPKALLPILQLLKENHVHVAIETALFAPEQFLRDAIPYIDYFIVDVKILQKELCRSVLGGTLSVYLQNVEILYKSGKLKLFRMPCCPEYTFTDSNRNLVHDFLKKYREIPVQIFEVHELGQKKYESLNKAMWKSEGIETESLEEFCRCLRKNEICADVIRI